MIHRQDIKEPDISENENRKIQSQFQQLTEICIQCTHVYYC